MGRSPPADGHWGRRGPGEEVTGARRWWAREGDGREKVAGARIAKDREGSWRAEKDSALKGAGDVQCRILPGFREQFSSRHVLGSRGMNSSRIPEGILTSSIRRVPRGEFLSDAHCSRAHSPVAAPGWLIPVHHLRRACRRDGPGPALRWSWSPALQRLEPGPSAVQPGTFIGWAPRLPPDAGRVGPRARSLAGPRQAGGMAGVGDPPGGSAPGARCLEGAVRRRERRRPRAGGDMPRPRRTSTAAPGGPPRSPPPPWAQG